MIAVFVFQLALSQFGASANAVGDMLCVRVLQAVNLRPTATSTTVNPLARVCLQLPGPGYRQTDLFRFHFHNSNNAEVSVPLPHYAFYV